LIKKSKIEAWVNPHHLSPGFATLRSPLCSAQHSTNKMLIVNSYKFTCPKNMQGIHTNPSTFYLLQTKKQKIEIVVFKKADDGQNFLPFFSFFSFYKSQIVISL
jgi:hypothetical protein